MEESNTALVEISRAELALQRASDIHDILDLRDRASAMQVFADAQGFREAAQRAKIFQLKAERKAGQWLADNVRAGNPQFRHNDGNGKIPDGVTENESRRWQLQASLPEERFNEWVDECLAVGTEITAAGLRRIAKNPHVSFNSGENEWYTPPEYISAARAVMGGIDLDPASSDLANQIVKADVYYTKDDDGLSRDWFGRVWMNPPYSSDLIDEFCEKLSAHFSAGDISQAIVLVNNATETGWFARLVAVASAVVFTRGRVKFIDTDGNRSGAPLQGQVFVYLGDNVDGFISAFTVFGWGATIYGK